jgi:hypothetical protein
MHAALRALAALALVALGSGAACSLLVANEFSGYSLATDSGICSLSNPNGTACGTCVSQYCQIALNNHCTEGIVSSGLTQCVADPSPQGTGSCNQFVGDAAFGFEDNDFDLRTCVSIHCSDPGTCTACTEVDAGSTMCGTCIMSQCGAILSGLNGCCGDPDIQNWVSDCTYSMPGHPTTCTTIEGNLANTYPNDGGLPSSVPADAGGCDNDFANCVYNNCVMGMAQCH